MFLAFSFISFDKAKSMALDNFSAVRFFLGIGFEITPSS